MRILTNSPINPKGLISIIEADEDAPQHAIFCIPIWPTEVANIDNLQKLVKYFKNGIVTKIKDSISTRIIELDFYPKSFFISNEDNITPRFITIIGGHKIEFYLPTLNFYDYNIHNKIKFDFFYDGNAFPDLRDKKFIILEANWDQLDKLFLETGILFTDWE